MDSRTGSGLKQAAVASSRPMERRAVRVGLVGRGIQLSRSPAMHEAEGRRLGIDYAYRLLDVEQMGPNPPALGEIVRTAEEEGFSGLNVTHPYKQEILGHVDRLSENAKAIGSVNTIVFADGRRSGHNTDLWGFRAAFVQELADAGRDRVLLLGAGGAGAAVAHALLEVGVGRLFLSDPDSARASTLLARLEARFRRGCALVLEDVGEVATSIDGLVNATPIGMAGRPGMPFPAERLRAAMWVADVVYFPIETALLRAARQAGCRTMSGEGMAVYQAVRAFEHFTGVAADPRTMRAAFAALDKPAR